MTDQNTHDIAAVPDALAAAAPHHDPYAALKYRDYRIYNIGSNLAVIGAQMTNLAVGWELYERTHQPIALAWIGLTHALPVVLLALPAGHIADQADRRRLLIIWQLLVILAALGLTAVSFFNAPVLLIYLCLFASGIAQAFISPARGALLPQLVPEELLSNAVTWNASAFQIASMIGPAIGGLVISLFDRAWPAYALSSGCQVVFLGSLCMLQSRGRVAARGERVTLQTLMAGIKFVRDTRIILATITLDLFAVLLGGAVALLPIYAKDILHVGPHGLGLLRAAPSAGALLMAVGVAHLPPMQKAGRALLLAVAAFGTATIIFGCSRNFWLSMLMLFITGAVDNISVVVRHTLVQILTPNEMRGRVSAVNSVFITISNDVGDFEAALVAQFFGPLVSVVSGGIGTLLVVAATALLWPEVRRFGALTRPGDR